MASKIILHSQVRALDRLTIFGLPAKPLENVRLVRVPNSNVIVAVDAMDKVYSSQANDGTRQYFDFTAGRIRHTIAGMVALKIISKAAVDEHKRRLEAEEHKSKMESEAGSLIEALGALGLKPTKAQLARLDKCMKPMVVRAKLAEAGIPV